MENSQIIETLRLTGLLMELHEENPFKVKGYQNAAFNLDKLPDQLSCMPLAELEKLEGIGKGMAAKIHEICTTGQLSELSGLTGKTPPGVVEMLFIKGIGPKKVRTIWKELNIESKEALLTACEENKISGLKGFGEKTQEAIRQALLFAATHQEKFLYAELEKIAFDIESKIREITGQKVSLAGDIRRRMEVVEVIQLIIASDNAAKTIEELSDLSFLEKSPKSSGPFVWRGTETSSGARVEIKIYSEKDFGGKLLAHSASKDHLLAEAKEGQSIFQFVMKNSFASEEAVYRELDLDYIEPEFREGYKEIQLAKEKKLPALIKYEDLKGVLHNHCTYSDGIHTLEQMAVYCKELGFEYLGISDHSKSAFYANGLYENRVRDQHKEIDELNKKLAPFRIFKGIESDILSDGALDYADEVLASFDFIVASIHSNLKMMEEKATQRLITAIENPYTTILGHPTGRLLLKREGYPINYRKVIDACAANKVAIEINAHPRRLDLDWRWVRYALEKEIMISINPDAHEMQGYLDMHYGVYMGRKAGLAKEMTLNALPLKELEKYFGAKKSVAIR